MAEDDIKESTISGVKWASLEQFSTQTVSFVLSIILARLLTPTDYGTIGVLSVFMAFSGTFIDSGFGQGLIRKLDCKDEDYSTILYFNIVVSLFCYIVLFACSSLISSFFKMPILTPIVKIYCLTLVINAFGTIPRTILTKNLKFKSIAKINVLSSLFSCIIGIVLAYAGWGVWALVWQAVLSAIFSNIILWIGAKWKPILTFSKKSFNEMFAFGSKLLAGGLLWQIYSNITPIIIGKFFSARDLGLYSRGANIAQLPAATIYGVLSKVSYPIFAKLQDNQERLIRIYRKYIKLSSMLIMFALILLVALAKPLVLILLTEKWAACILFLQLYAFAVLTDHIDKLNLNLLIVVGRTDLHLKLEVYKRIISLSVLFASIPFGVVGICISKIIYAQIALIFNTYYTGKLFGMGYFRQIKDFIPYILLSLIAVAPAFILTYTIKSNWIALIIGTILALGIYIGLLKYRKDESFIELLTVMKERFPYKKAM